MSKEHNHDNEHEHEHITIIDEEGNEELYEILFTFESDDFGKSYVLVYPMGTNEEEEVELSAFSYKESEGGLEGSLSSIDSDEEWEMIEEVLNTFISEEEDEYEEE